MKPNNPFVISGITIAECDKFVSKFKGGGGMKKLVIIGGTSLVFKAPVGMIISVQ